MLIFVWGFSECLDVSSCGFFPEEIWTDDTVSCLVAFLKLFAESWGKMQTAGLFYPGCSACVCCCWMGAAVQRPDGASISFCRHICSKACVPGSLQEPALWCREDRICAKLQLCVLCPSSAPGSEHTQWERSALGAEQAGRASKGPELITFCCMLTAPFSK